MPGKIGGWPDSLRESPPARSIQLNAGRVRLGLGALLIFALVFLAYTPILPGNFLMDDHRLIKEDNSLVTGEMSPLTFWFQTDFTLSAVVWWLQWLAWGDHPAYYHLVNILLHAVSAVLLWRVLAWLKIPGAWFAAMLFAVHPVCVNSVARIAELKNTLSLPFFILSFWAYLRYEAAEIFPAPTANPERRRLGTFWYGVALVAFVLALLSKTSTVMLPVVLLASAAWQRRRITRSDWLHAGPFFILALAFGLMSIWFQKHQALAAAGQTLAPESFFTRLAVAGHVIWFYLGKALLPVDLNLIYARWQLAANPFLALIPVLLLLAALALAWWFRQTWGRHLLFGLGCFIITLFPVLGLFDSQFLATWQVSDHLQYLPLMAPVVLVAAGLFSSLKPSFAKPAGMLLVVLLAVLTFQRAQVFSTEESLLRDTLQKNPDASSAHNDLGVILAERRDIAGATAHFQAAVLADPANAGAHLNLGQALAMTGDFAGAEPQFLAAISLRPEDSQAHKRFADALRHQGKSIAAASQLQTAICLSRKPDVQTRLDLASLLYQTGKPGPAVVQYRKILSGKPDMPETLNNLAWLLATCSDDSVRDGAAAVQYAEHACQLTSYQQTGYLSTLAAAYAEAGRFPDAITTANLAIKLQNANGQTRFAALNQQFLQLYAAGQPYHEPPPASATQ